MAGGGQVRVWYHKQLGRMETEKLLMESKEDGSFLIRESDTVRGAYVLSTVYQQRIHHYRILPDDEGLLSIQAQQGVQKKKFKHLDDMVEYYRHSRRGLVCALTLPIAQSKEGEGEDKEEEEPDSDDDTGGGTDSMEGGSREKNLVSNFLLAFLSTVDTSKVDAAFLEQVRSYLNKDVSMDIESMTTPTPHLNSFKQLFYKDCVTLHRQLNKMMAQLDLMKALFERAGGAKHGDIAPTTKRKRSSTTDTGYDTLPFKLSDCADAVTGLETIAFQMLRELSASMSGNKGVSSNSLVQPVPNGVAKQQTRPHDDGDEDVVTFEVKVEGGLNRKTLVITVNLKEGRFQFFKPGDSQRTSYEHNQLLQLVKSRSRDSRLSVLIQGQNRKEYIFSDMQSRERFCQVTQLIRNRMLAGEDQDIISVFVGSWNMGDAPPPQDINSWVRSLGQGKTLPLALSQAHDLYAFGTQETNFGEREWIAKMRQTLKGIYDIDYEKVVCTSLWGMRCLIMAKPEHINKISHVQTSSVKTGIGNTLGNKGGVGISFFFGSVSLGFICTHLTSGNEKCSRRNQNYHDILKGMNNLKQKKLSQFDLTNQFTHLFFFGDLNYRVDMSATEIVQHAKDCNHFAIYQEDQLRKEKEKKAVFVGFEETPILFPPTYRFQKNTRTLDDYVWVKQKRSGIRINVPSYCDRVLWRSYPGTSIVNTSYGCTDDIMTSDHSPIFATFQLHGFKQYAPNQEDKNEKAHIVFLECNARIATSSKTNFYMEFYSPCFEGTVKTVPNNDWKQTTEPNCTWPVWKPRDPLANIKPIVTEESYLEQQHVLVMLKSQEGDEPYAECVLSLRGVIGKDPVPITRDLTHQGHSVGVLDILMHVTLDSYRVRRKEEELYTEVNFITQDEPSGISLDRPGANRGRSRQVNSESESGRHPSEGARDTFSTRPMLPIPRTNSQSGMDRHRTNNPSPLSGSLPTSHPPPPCRRGEGEFGQLSRDLNTAAPLPVSARPQLPTPSTRPMDIPPPAVPVRRTDNTKSLSRSDQAARENLIDLRAQGATSPVQNAPVPARRRPAARQMTNPLPGVPGDQNPPAPPPSTRNRQHSDTLHTPTSASHTGPPPPHSPRTRQPSDTLPPMPGGAGGSGRGGGGGMGGGPPVPRRQGGNRSPRPLSSVESLLYSHGLQHFSEQLLSNGFDDLKFLAEVTEAELAEIGITQAPDREKLLRVFKGL